MDLIDFILTLFLVKDAHKLPSLGCAFFFMIGAILLLAFIAIVVTGG